MKKKHSKYPTLRALVAGWMEGEMSRAKMIETLDAIEMGIGLDKRDKAIAEHLENGPATFESHPMYQAGYQACIAEVTAVKEAHLRGAAS